MSDPPDVDIDEATLDLMRKGHATIERLQAEIQAAGSYGERRALQREFVEQARRHEGLMAEIPGLEEYVRRFREMRERLEAQYGLGDG